MTIRTRLLTPPRLEPDRGSSGRSRIRLSAGSSLEELPLFVLAMVIGLAMAAWA